MKKNEWTFKSADGLEMYARSWAPEQPPRALVCLIHGMGEHTGRYEHVAAALGSAGHAMVGFDLRGHGKSGGPRGHAPSAAAMLDDIDRFLQQAGERFPGLPRFLYGHSLGGIWTLYYVPSRKPELVGAIATAPAMHSAIEQQKVKKLLARVLGTLTPTLTMPSGLDPATLSHDPAVVKAYIEDPLVHDRITTGFGKMMMDVIQRVFALAPSFPVPVLVMHGEQDALGYPSGSRKFAELAPQTCTLKIWPGMFHEIHNEPDKAQVFAFMIEWMNQRLARK